MSSLVAVFLAFFTLTTAQAGTIITALGDSLTAGYGLAPEEAFPVILEKLLKERGHDVTIHNMGQSGDTTAQGLERLEWAMMDDPQIVIIELGANDALRGQPVSEAKKNLGLIISALKQDGRQVLLAGMLAPPNMGSEYGDAFNNIYTDLAAEHDIPLYPFFLDGVAGEPDLNQRDGIHPTAEGVRIITSRILPYVEQLLPPR